MNENNYNRLFFYFQIRLEKNRPHFWKIILGILMHLCVYFDLGHCSWEVAKCIYKLHIYEIDNSVGYTLYILFWNYAIPLYNFKKKFIWNNSDMKLTLSFSFCIMKHFQQVFFKSFLTLLLRNNCHI